MITTKSSASDARVTYVVAEGPDGGSCAVVLGFVRRLLHVYYPHTAEGEAIGDRGHRSHTTAVKMVVRKALRDGGLTEVAKWM